METRMAGTGRLLRGQYTINQALTKGLEGLVADYIKASDEMDVRMKEYREKAKAEKK
jgi:hypothetical protein